MYSDNTADLSATDDLFKQSFKRYKSRKSDIDYSEVVDFQLFHHYHHQHNIMDNMAQKTSAESSENSNSSEVLDNFSSISVIDIINEYSGVSSEEGESQRPADLVFGLKPRSQWGVYSHKGIPGLIFIVDPFMNSNAKDYWIEQCLMSYHQRPNICNLDAHSSRSEDLWTDFVKTMTNGAKINRTELFKLRWVTLGYHYDWTEKLYYKDKRSDFPHELSELSKYLARSLGFSYYSAEAGIVNYYHLDSTLAGHTDHSEYDMESPLFSISFGCGAIFLIGGKTKSTKPVPIYLRSGDIVVMAGESRLAYHAVPKIFPPSVKGDSPTISRRSDEEEDSESHRKWMREYMRQSRININIRQVLKQGQEFPDHPTDDKT